MKLNAWRESNVHSIVANCRLCISSFKRAVGGGGLLVSVFVRVCMQVDLGAQQQQAGGSERGPGRREERWRRRGEQRGGPDPGHHRGCQTDAWQQQLL